MAVADLLEKIGEGAKTVGRVAGAVAEPLAKRTAEVVSGEAPEIDQDKRARAEDALLRRHQRVAREAYRDSWLNRLREIWCYGGHSSLTSRTRHI